MPYAGWSGPIPSVNLTIIAYPGTVHFRAGKRTAQRHTYAPFFPVLQYNQEQGLFFGGNFWDSRATGYRLRNPDAEQAQGPPVDTQEMGFPDTACVAFRLKQSVYKPLFTCFGSANEGLPLNPRNAFYYQTTPDSFGFIGNPYGFGYRDLGMGTFLRSGFGSGPNPNRTWIQFAPSVDGQFQVATTRNVAMTPPQCPTTEAGTGKPYFQKEFFITATSRA
jgi:cytochrome c peroxidase